MEIRVLFTSRSAPIRALPAGSLAVLLTLGAGALPTTAHAYWHGGVFFGFPPVVVGPPVYYPPPVVYAAPPMVYAPPPVVYDPGPPAARSCYAGAYVCPLDRPTPPGGPCSCPTETGRASGNAR
jgi:hypothetical protein